MPRTVNVNYVTKEVKILLHDSETESLAAATAIAAAESAQEAKDVVVDNLQDSLDAIDTKTETGKAELDNYTEIQKAEISTLGQGYVDEANTILTAIRNEYGYPFVASTVADMTDPTKIYVYTGSENGYTNGNWYYYGLDCNRVSNQTAQINGNWYGFDYSGIMAKNGTLDWHDSATNRWVYIRAKEDGRLYVNEWYKVTNNRGEVSWYYYGEEGHAAQGFQRVNGHDYCFGYDGRMNKNTTVSGDGYSYAVDENGYAIRLNQNGWSKANGYWYYCIDGETLENHVRKIDGSYYGFDGIGRMYTDTSGNAVIAYVNGGKKIVLVWAHDDETEEYYYYRPTASGAMVTNTWLKVSDKRWYYFGADAKAYKGGQYTINGKKYSFDENSISDGQSVTQTGWSQSGGSWYYYTASGDRATGWQQISGKWYYFNSNGVMQTGWQQINGKWYYLESSGAMVTGWKQINGKWYYFSGSGVMQTGWVQVNGKWYYMSGSGAMQTGWQKINNKWYFFEPGGQMVTGWKQINGKWYYFEGSGAMLANTSRQLNGKTKNITFFYIYP